MSIPAAGKPLSVWAEALCAAVQRGRANEADLRHDAFLVLGPFLLDEVGMSPTSIQHEHSSTSGRYDSLFGTALVEYKRPGLLSIESERRRAARQAVEYLNDAGLGVNVAIVTDGETWGVLRDAEPATDAALQLALDLGVTTHADPADLFQWRQTSLETAERILSLLASVRSVPVSSQTISATLGIRRAETQNLVRELARALAERESDSRADILFNQWLQLAGVTYGIGSRDQPWPRRGRSRVLGDQLADVIPERTTYAESIFVLHTFVALACKLIASEVLALIANQPDARPSQWTSLDNLAFSRVILDLEHGEHISRLRAPGLFAGDLFGWYAERLSHDVELLRDTRGVVTAFAELAWPQLANVQRRTGDLLREFYTDTIPRSLRRSLGEFFTPEWLAERVFSRAVELMRQDLEAPQTILDPACGSGTFVVIAFNYLVDRARVTGSNEAEAVQIAMDSVTGFDINPISALMTRVNLLLNLGTEAEELPEVTFRVFQADSILLPEELLGQVAMERQHEVVRLPLVIGDIFLPRPLSTIEGLHALVRVVESSLENERPADLFRTRLSVELTRLGLQEPEVNEALPAAEAIYAQLGALHRDGRDGVWANVIEQAFAPRLVGRVDLIVGNPPWISWKHTPQAWQDRSESLWRSFGLWQRRARGGGVPLADLSSLLLARSLATYAPAGLVALLLPLSFLMADPGSRAIRRCLLRTPDEDRASEVAHVDVPYAPLAVDDFSSLNPFPDAATMPIALYVRPGVMPSFPIPSVKWLRAVPRTRLRPHESWSATRAMLTPIERPIAPLHSTDTASIWVPQAGKDALEPLSPEGSPAYSWGQGFHTRGADGLYVCDVLTPAPTRDGLIRIRSQPDAGDNTRGEAPREGVVEAEFVWPLLRGEAVGRLRYEPPTSYIVVPHDPDDVEAPLSVHELALRAPRLFDFLEPLIDRLATRSAYDLNLDAEHPFAIQGAFQHLSGASSYVASRYIAAGGRPPTSPVFRRFYTALGRETVPYFNNKSNFLRADSEDEAWFVAAFISSPSTQDLLGRISVATTITPRKLGSVPIPRFDQSNEDHMRLADLGRASVEESAWGANVEDIDVLVLRLAAGSTPAT
jgi:hypothetical protein